MNIVLQVSPLSNIYYIKEKSGALNICNIVNSKLLFSQTGCSSNDEDPSFLYYIYLLLREVWKKWIHTFPKGIIVK